MVTTLALDFVPPRSMACFCLLCCLFSPMAGCDRFFTHGLFGNGFAQCHRWGTHSAGSHGQCLGKFGFWKAIAKRLASNPSTARWLCMHGSWRRGCICVMAGRTAAVAIALSGGLDIFRLWWTHPWHFVFYSGQACPHRRHCLHHRRLDAAVVCLGSIHRPSVGGMGGNSIRQLAMDLGSHRQLVLDRRLGGATNCACTQSSKSGLNTHFAPALKPHTNAKRGAHSPSSHDQWL